MKDRIQSNKVLNEERTFFFVLTVMRRANTLYSCVKGTNDRP